MSNIKKLTVLQDDELYTAVVIETAKDSTRVFIVANQDIGESDKHSVKVNGKEYQWTGPYLYSSKG